MKKFLIAILCACTMLSVQGQDIHFSQYFASPLTLNPAMTGAFNADFRFAANYRNQHFNNFGTPYSTFSGSFDMALFRKKLEMDQFGVGLMAYNDKQGDGALTTTSVMASVAYHRILDNRNDHTLSVGFQGGIVQKRIDFEQLTFENQYDGDTGFNPLTPSGENENDNSILYPDFGVGVLWRGRFSNSVNAYAGISYFHLNNPAESLLGRDDNDLSARLAFHGGTNIVIGKSTSLTPGFLVLSQNTAFEASLGAAFGYDFNDISSIYFGAWYRFGDALIPMVAYEISGLRIGVSYDASLSGIKDGNNSNGGVEVSLIYIHNQEPVYSFSPTKFCPKF